MPKSKQHKEFAYRLAQAMARCGWTGRGRAERLAEALRKDGLEKATSQLVSTWLRGERMPSGAYADRLPKILNVPSGHLSGADVPEFVPQLPQAERSTVREGAAGGAGRDSYSSAHGGDLALSPVAIAAAPALRPDQEETARMAANALQRALRLVQTQLHGVRDREIMAEELEHFADRLRERLHFDDAAADLYKAALNLRKAPGRKDP